MRPVLLALCLLLPAFACSASSPADQASTEAPSVEPADPTPPPSPPPEDSDATDNAEESESGDPDLEPQLDLAKPFPPACADSLSPTGVDVGDIAPNFTTTDQFGQPFSLHDYCDKTVYIHYGTMWCGYCKIRAPTLDDFHYKYAPYDVVVVAVYAETDNYTPPTAEDLEQWSELYGLEDTIVVADPGWEYYREVLDAGYATPAGLILAPGGVVHAKPNPSEGELQDLLYELGYGERRAPSKPRHFLEPEL